MLLYNKNLKQPARGLRRDMTEGEKALWSRLRRKQLGVQFYRQKPLGEYIVDFFAPKAKLVIEVDGSQHLSDEGKARDAKRDRFLVDSGLRVMRFDSRQVLRKLDTVVEEIFRVVSAER